MLKTYDEQTKERCRKQLGGDPSHLYDGVLEPQPVQVQRLVSPPVHLGGHGGRHQCDLRHCDGDSYAVWIWPRFAVLADGFTGGQYLPGSSLHGKIYHLVGDLVKLDFYPV